jgi:hypothetical protein
VKVSGGGNRRVSLAALVCIKPGCRPRLIYRVHHAQAPQRPAQGVHRDRLRPAAGRRAPAAARAWLRVYRLPPYAHELKPVKPIWSHLKRSLANLAKRNLAQLTALIKTRLRRMQYRPGLLGGFLASTGLDLTPFCEPRN